MSEPLSKDQRDRMEREFSELLPMLAEAFAVDPRFVRRVIIDAQFGSWPKVYIETSSGGQLLDLDWSKGLKGAEVTILNKPAEDKP